MSPKGQFIGGHTLWLLGRMCITAQGNLPSTVNDPIQIPTSLEFCQSWATSLLIFSSEGDRGISASANKTLGSASKQRYFGFINQHSERSIIQHLLERLDRQDRDEFLWLARKIKSSFFLLMTSPHDYPLCVMETWKALIQVSRA